MNRVAGFQRASLFAFSYQRFNVFSIACSFTIYRVIAMHFLLFYTTSSDYPTRREQFRANHLRLAWQAVERGELILGGALADPTDGAVLVFRGESPDVATRFAESDP